MKVSVYTFFSILLLINCTPSSDPELTETIQKEEIPEAQYMLTKDQTHNRFSRSISPVLTVPSGSVIEMFTEEASDQQLTQDSDTMALVNLSFDPIHPLTGPIFVSEAAPGDILAVKFHKIETMGWGWAAIIPGFGFLASEFPQRVYKTFAIDSISQTVAFNDRIKLPIRPFAGVIGVAPDTDSLLITLPPRANGGNMDDPNITEGTTVYLPVFVPGALFSLGDAHVVQGLGEVSGTAIEAPMRFVVELNLIKGGNPIKEPQYETDDYYAVTAFGTTIDIAAKKAVQYMIDYLMAEHQLERSEAYMLCSFAGDLKIAEVVDVPHVLVTMHISKEVLGIK